MQLSTNTAGKIIPANYFGMHINNALPPANNPYNSTQCPLFSDLGYKLIRLWDGYVVDRLLRPSNGVYNWTGMDYRVNAAIEAGCEIMFTFGAMPDWATTAPGPFPNYNPNPPTQMSFLTDFVQQLVTRYAGRIKYYEIWNEVDSDGSWVGTLQQMVDIGQAIYPVIKAADPNAIVLSPNTISWGSLNVLTGLQFQDAWLKQASAFCDVVSMHFYTDPTEPESYFRLARAYKNLAKKYNKDVVLCSETGVLSYYDQNGVLKKPLTNGVGDMMPEEQAAGWIARMLMCSWLGGVEMFCYYKMDNQNIMAIQMINYQGGGPVATIKYKPFFAFKYLAGLLTGGTLSNFKQKGYNFSAQFTTADGRSGDVFWCKDYRTYTKDITSYSSATDCAGNPVALSANYTVTSSPVFLFR